MTFTCKVCGLVLRNLKECLWRCPQIDDWQVSEPPYHQYIIDEGRREHIIFRNDIYEYSVQNFFNPPMLYLYAASPDGARALFPPSQIGNFNLNLDWSNLADCAERIKSLLVLA